MFAAILMVPEAMAAFASSACAEKTMPADINVAKIISAAFMSIHLL
ncbi:hypothetical protein APV28_5039 [Comamonas testosteroni]|nr:hypothetical protein APV28_5039 [Comamonas testosteroni]